MIYIKTKDYQTLVELKDRLEHYMRDNRAFKDTVVQFDFNPMSGFKNKEDIMALRTIRVQETLY